MHSFKNHADTSFGHFKHLRKRKNVLSAKRIRHHKRLTESHVYSNVYTTNWLSAMWICLDLILGKADTN